MGIFMYLYSPFLDHWFGNEAYSRPHNHVHVSTDFVSQISPHLDHRETGSSVESVDQDQHEEGILCLLDIDALLALLLAFDIAPCAEPVQHAPLALAFTPAYRSVSIIHLASLDPPPNI
jgi:hypothetical protein